MTRAERIVKMLHELRYEIEVGMMQGDIEESMRFTFIVPISKSMPEGVVVCRFETRPMHKQNAFGIGLEEPRLRIVK
jgi:hypothetical protein